MKYGCFISCCYRCQNSRINIILPDNGDVMRYDCQLLIDVVAVIYAVSGFVCAYNSVFAEFCQLKLKQLF